MIVDTSAVIAILREEPDAERYVEALGAAPGAALSAATYVEAAVVVDASGDPVLSARFDELLRVAGIVVEPLTAEHAALARAAYRDFGKGSGHPARLNFGDCFSYALARANDDTLLFKGNDFSHTDVRPALPET
ncbi:MAG: type II toxin-antitoxin system VapC family toxin [Motilibacteraceae bacterium]